MFQGNISLLLFDKEHADFETFVRRKGVVEKLFDQEGVTVGKENNLLGRTLLAIGLDLENGTLWLGGRNGPQYWKDHLKNNHYRPHIISVVDKLIGLDNIREQLEKIIEENKDSYSNNVWKKNLIENPALFKEYSYYGKIVYNWRGINLYEQQNFNSKVNAVLIENNRNEIITEIRKATEMGFQLSDPKQLRHEKFYTGEKVVLTNGPMKLEFEKDELNISFTDSSERKSVRFADINLDNFIQELKKHYAVKNESQISS